MQSKESADRSCPRCGAPATAGRGDCWLCMARERERAAAAASASPAKPVVSFHMTQLMAVIAVGCVAAGVWRDAPGVGVLVSVCLAPVLIRTSSIAALRRQEGRPLSVWESALTLAASLAVVSAILVATFAAFVVVCFPIGMMGFSSFPDSSDTIFMAAAWGLGIGAATFVFSVLIRRSWPRRREPAAAPETEEPREDDRR